MNRFRRVRPPLGVSLPVRLALPLALSLTATDADAGNLDAFYLSGQSAMQAGAITADAEGGGAIWYNPAGLAYLDGVRLDVGVNGYGLRFGGHADLASGIDNAEVTRLSRIDLNVVPTALGITRRFGKIGVGIGAFVPTQNHQVLRTHFVTPAQEPNKLDFSFDSSTRLQQYHVGAGLGFHVSRRLSLGAAFFFTYQTLIENTDVSLFTSRSGEEQALASHYSLDTVQLGAEFVASMQWTPAPAWRFGGTTRFPALRLGEIGQRVETSQLAAGGELTVDNQFSQSLQINTSIISPFRFHVGLSHDFSGNVHGALEASLLLPFVDPNLRVDLRPTYNARIGLRKDLGPRMAIGGGLFTDLSPNQKPTEFQESQLNFFGLTAALDLGTVYGVYAKNDQPLPRAQALRFGTTLSFSYALGTGTVVQAQLTPSAAGGYALASVREEVIAHELTLHIATTVME